MPFVRAQRKRVKARICIGGLSKSGKSFTSLMLLRGIVGEAGRIAAIDTESGALSLYSKLTDFDVQQINHFSPDTYVKAIDEAVRGKYDGLLIDSASHEWMGTGGVLDMVDQAPQNDKFFTGWKNATPKHNKFIQALVAAPLHVVVTMRQKAEYAIEKNEQGKNVPVKIGMQLIQREGTEYEFNFVGVMDLQHTLRIQYSCVDFLPNGTIVPTADGLSLGASLRRWLESGEGDWTPPQFAKAFYVNDREVISAGVERGTYVRILNLGAALDKAAGRGTAKAMLADTGKVSTADLSEEEAKVLLVAMEARLQVTQEVASVN